MDELKLKSIHFDSGRDGSIKVVAILGMSEIAYSPGAEAHATIKKLLLERCPVQPKTDFKRD